MIMKLAILCVVVTALLLQAATLGLAGGLPEETFSCTAAETGGAWNVASTWVNCTNGVPGANDTVLVRGPKAVVTIASGQSVSVILLEVSGAATVASKGSLSAEYLRVHYAKLTSTGKVTLATHNGDGENAGLYAYNSDVKLSSDLTVSGFGANIRISTSDVTVGGSVNVTSDDGMSAQVSLSESRFSVAGDMVIVGGLSNGPELPPWDDKRGLFHIYEGSGLFPDTSSVEVKGNLEISSRDHTGNTTSEYSTTDTALILTQGSQVVVGGDVLIRSGNALVAKTGGAYFQSVATASTLLTTSPDTVRDNQPSMIVVGGSVTVKSGSVTDLNDSDNDGSEAGSASFDVAITEAYINGSSKSNLTVQSGSGGSSSTYKGGMASEAYVAIGAGSRLVVTNDVVVQAGNGGNGGNREDGDNDGGSAGLASLGVIYGGEMLVGGEMRVIAGRGGNASDDAGGKSGKGGAGSILVTNGGSIDVAGDVLVSSGSSGLSARGAEAYEAVVVMNAMSAASPIERGFGGYYYMGTGASNLRVGGDLNITGGSAGSSSHSGEPGGSCRSGSRSNTLDVSLGGLVVENLWDGEVIIGGDINIRGCNGGDSADRYGGDALATGILASGGVSLAVYGSVNVQAGSGGATSGSDSGGQAATAHVIAMISSDITVAGSLTTVAGNGGDVINGTGQPGYASSDVDCGVLALSNSHIIVQGAVTVSGGRGGNVDTDQISHESGSSPPVVRVFVAYRSSLVAGSLRVELGTTGNSTRSSSSATGPVEKRTNMHNTASNNRREQQRWSKLSQLEEKLNLASEAEKRGIVFPGGPQSSGVAVRSMSSLTINGDVVVIGGPTPSSTYAYPAGGTDAAVSLFDFSTATIKGDISVVAESAGSTLSSSYDLNSGGTAEIFVGVESVLKAQGNVRLQGGDGSSGPNSTFGRQGVAYFELADRAKFFQSGLFVLRDGKGVNVTDPTSSTGIYLSRSEWTVYPCDGAGIEMTQRNSSFFQLKTFATFKDCRGAGAKQRYPEPTSDGSADASCSPCTCQEAALSSCPDQSSAAHLQANSVVAWLVAGVLQWW